MLILALAIGGCAGDGPETQSVSLAPENAVPEWAADAVFYQIFPERFRNGDPENDPTRASLEYPIDVPENWAVMPWTADWYARADWEREMSERFYDTLYKRRFGGDLQGVVDRLDYLVSLGINAVYFNPVFWARSLHKYDGNSFHHIDPYFGPDPEGDLRMIGEESADPGSWRWTSADSLFLALIGQAHARGIRIVIDGVFNHTGRDFFAFADLRERQEDSPYRDWYIVLSFDDPETEKDEFDWEGWWGYKPLASLAETPDGTDLRPGPRQYIFDATARWMDPDGDGDPSDGIDGWRLDVASDVPVGFWADWNSRVRTLNPEAYTVSEVWDAAAVFLSEAGFSATMNYYGFAYPVKGYIIDGTLDAAGFWTMIEDRRAAHDPARQYAMMNLIDSHDTERLGSMIVNSLNYPYEEPGRFDYNVDTRSSPRRAERYLVRKPDEHALHILRLVTLFQMTYVGAPTIYYGTEAGMWGPKDPDDRMPMVWPDLEYDDQARDPLGRQRKADPVAFDDSLYAFYRQAIALRRSQRSLRLGDIQKVFAEGHVLAFSRTFEEEYAVVVLNRSEDTGRVVFNRLDLPLDSNEGLYPIFVTRGNVTTVEPDLNEDGSVELLIPPLTGAVYIRTGEE